MIDMPQNQSKPNQLTAITVKVYNALLLNHIQPEIKKIYRKIKTVFEEITLQPHRFWQSVKWLKEYEQRILEKHNY